MAAALCVKDWSFPGDKAAGSRSGNRLTGSGNEPLGNLLRYPGFAGYCRHAQTAAGISTNIPVFLQPGCLSLIQVLTAHYLVVALGGDGSSWAADST